MVNNKTEKEKPIIYIFIFAALAKLTFGVFFYNRFDVTWYRDWILDMNNGLFDIYARADSIALDYPPLFLLLVSPVNLLYRIIAPDTYEMADMLFMKLIPILFDILCGVLILKITKKSGNPDIAIFALIFWLINPSATFNSAFWGQTDSVLAFFILLTFWLLSENKPVASTVVFACACMIKYQCAFFAPIYLIGMVYVLKKKEIKWLLYSAIAGILTVAAVFVPFSVGAHNPWLIFDVYFGSVGSYPYCTVNASNLYSVLGLNWQPDSTEMFLGVTYKAFGYGIVAAGILYVVCLWHFGEKKSLWMSGFFLMEHIFIFMPDMHERYQFVVLPLLLVVWALYREKRHLWLFIALTLTTLGNQFVVLANYIKTNLPWQGHFNSVLGVIAVFNLAFYLWSLYEFTAFSFKSDKKTV